MEEEAVRINNNTINGGGFYHPIYVSGFFTCLYRSTDEKRIFSLIDKCMIMIGNRSKHRKTVEFHSVASFKSICTSYMKRSI